MRWALETCASEPQTLSALFFHLKKNQNNKTQPPSPTPPKNPKTDKLGGGKPCFPLFWVKNCEVVWRIGNEDNVTCCFPGLWVHTFFLSWLCLRCKTRANRPVLFTKLICMPGKPWVCGPGGAGKVSCSSQLCRAAGPMLCDHCEPHQASAGVAINSRQLKYIRDRIRRRWK